jgi:hypothetical protein
MKEARAKSARILLVAMLGLGLWLAAAPSSGAQAPTVNLSPSSGPIGTKVTVSACGMTPGNTVAAGNITFGGSPWSTRLTVPPNDVGPTAVTVRDGAVTATGVFTVTQPNVTVWPTSGYKGDTITISGSGWLSPSVVTVTFQGSKVESVYTSAAGSFQVQFTVPLTAAPSNVIQASDSLGNVGPAVPFYLSPPGMELSPLSGPAGTIVQVHGYGLEPLWGVENLQIADMPIGDLGLITNDTGAFLATFEAPSLPGGGYIVTATVADVTLDACFTIFEPDVWGHLPDGFPVAIEDALATIWDELVRVWGYHDGVWRMYDPADPLGSNLTGLVGGRGYWVKVSGECALPGDREPLDAGWNAIGLL